MSARSSGFTMEKLIQAGMCSHPTELPSLPLAQRSELPSVPGIYFVLGEDNEILYIGQSISLWRRWSGAKHEKLSGLQSLGNVRLAWIELESVADLEEAEKVLIGHFSPRLNGSRGRGKRNDPDFSPTTVFLRKSTKLKAAAVRANQLLLGEDDGNMDLSDLLESLLLEWIDR